MEDGCSWSQARGAVTPKIEPGVFLSIGWKKIRSMAQAFDRLLRKTILRGAQQLIIHGWLTVEVCACIGGALDGLVDSMVPHRRVYKFESLDSCWHVRADKLSMKERARHEQFRPRPTSRNFNKIDYVVVSTERNIISCGAIRWSRDSVRCRRTKTRYI